MMRFYFTIKARLRFDGAPERKQVINRNAPNTEVALKNLKEELKAWPMDVTIMSGPRETKK